MSENLSDAFIILAVGMITVFVILSLVVFTGKVLIRITNRYAPPSPKIQKSNTNQFASISSNNISNTNPNLLEKEKIAAIVGTVEFLTKGKGKIKSIEKL